MSEFVGAIDCGTTSARFFVFDQFANVIVSHQEEYNQHYPRPGWHEQDPLDWVKAIDNCIHHAIHHFKALGYDISQIKSVGITNQRETTIAWNKTTGKSLHNAIAWPDARTTSIVHALSAKKSKFGQGVDQLKVKTGLPISNYFTAIKLKWLVDNVEAVKEALESDNLLVGTVDTYLLWHYTGGVKGGIYLTDITNASRTMFMDLRTLNWCPDLVSFFGFDPNQLIPKLPKIVSNSDSFGHFVSHPNLSGVLISGLIGDQQSSLVGNQCFSLGESKNTYGTGCFMLYNTGEDPVQSTHGLITTPGYQLAPGGPTAYALEGAIAVAGSSVEWVKNNLGLISSSAQIGELAAEVPDTGGVYFVTGFSGLFAPYWDDTATGLLIGLTGFTTRAHIARATLEATCFQTKAILDAMALDQHVSSIQNTPSCAIYSSSPFFMPRAGHTPSSSAGSDFASGWRSPITPGIDQDVNRKQLLAPTSTLPQGTLKLLKVDGGMTASDTLLQLQADLLGVDVERAEMKETTALGAALLAGHAIGLFGWDLNRPETLKAVNKFGKKVFRSKITAQERAEKYKGWNKAISKSKGWFEDEMPVTLEPPTDKVQIADSNGTLEGISSSEPQANDYLNQNSDEALKHRNAIKEIFASHNLKGMKL
ncbi:hypothetical protein O181_047694 [Austropuccinia psidii MF-1]|uniref:glycerol kinase n=1 Tax=Austropuccinia psidii MF-1 TaxID=1389203 RepID=A0A9Q3DRC1_9BASI|nr:hypothetical protein [Austropuccinia psidii MF-1]